MPVFADFQLHRQLLRSVFQHPEHPQVSGLGHDQLVRMQPVDGLGQNFREILAPVAR